MTIVTLIRIDAQDASGAALPVRLASHDRPDACHVGGEQWEPALATLPAFALDVFGGAFNGQVTAPGTSFTVATIGLAAFGPSASARARFADARVRIWVGDITSAASADLGPLILRFDGRITAEPQIDDAARVASFDAAVRDSWADDPLLGLFAGTGGIEGPADLTGQPKPLVLGNVRFAGGTLIDQVDNVWMVSDGPIQGISAAYDRLASLGPSAGDSPSLAALKAANIPNGSWGTCLAQGLVRFGAPPDGRVSFDVQGSNSGTGGFVRRPGGIIRRIAERVGGTVNAASLTALDSARPYNLQLQLREQVTARDVIRQIADSVAAVAGVSLRGELFAQPLAIGTPSDVLAADDSGPWRLARVEALPIAAPAWKLATEAELTFEVHSADEVAFEYRWQGEYAAARVYRMDDVVTGPDGAAWAWINSTPAAGQALPVWPTESNAHWRLFQPPGGAGISVVNGVIQGIATPGIPIDNRRVMVPGLDASLPAGDFIGQQLATTDTGEVLRWNGTAWIKVSDVTGDHIAAGFLYQGVLSTQNAVLPTQVLVGSFDNPIPDNNYRDRDFWGLGSSGVASLGDIDAGWEQPRALFFNPVSDFDFSSQFFDIEVGATYRVRCRIWNNDGAAGWSGAFWPMIHMPWVAWWSLRHGTGINPDLANAGNAIVANGDTGHQDFYFRATSAQMRRIQFRFKSTARGSLIVVQVQLTKVPALGRDLMQPGLDSPYPVEQIVTAEGIAAGILNQREWATSNIPTSRLSNLNDQGRTVSRRALSQIAASGVLQLLDVVPLSADTDGSGVATITVGAHNVYDDVGTLSFSSSTIGGLAAGTLYFVYENNPDFVGGARSYVATTNRVDITQAGRRFVGWVSTPAVGQPPATGEPPPGGGEIP